MKISITKVNVENKFYSISKDATLSLDRLSINCISPRLSEYLRIVQRLSLSNQKYRINEHVFLTLNRSLRDNCYKSILDVYYDDQRFAHIAIDPFAFFLNEEVIRLTVYNHRLYQANWTDYLHFVMVSMHLEFHSYSSLEVALDSDGLLCDLLELYYTENLTLIRGDFSGDLVNKRLSDRKGFRKGARRSDFYISCYKKSEDYVNKPYIERFHKLNGLISNNVDRIELRIKGDRIARRYDVSWYDLGREDVLVRIFCNELQSRIVFKDMSDYWYKNGNRVYKRIPFVEFESEQMAPLKRSRINIEEVDCIKGKKIAVKQFYLFSQEHPSEVATKVLKDFLEFNNLKSWFSGKYKHWDADYGRDGAERRPSVLARGIHGVLRGLLFVNLDFPPVVPLDSELTLLRAA